MPLTSRFSRGEVNLANWKNNGKLIDSIIYFTSTAEGKSRTDRERAEIISGSNSRIIQGQSDHSFTVRVNGSEFRLSGRTARSPTNLRAPDSEKKSIFFLLLGISCITIWPIQDHEMMSKEYSKSTSTQVFNRWDHNVKSATRRIEFHRVVFCADSDTESPTEGISKQHKVT